MSFLLHINILDAFICSNNGKHIFTFCTLKKRMRMKMKMEISTMILRALLPHMNKNSDTNTPAIELLVYHACKLLKL